MHRFRIVVAALVLLTALVPLAGTASHSLVAQDAAPAPQGTGRIIGRVVDAAQGAPIAGALVSIPGTAHSATSALDGRYTLLGVPAGAVELSVRMIGYQPKAVTGVVVRAGDVVAQNVSLSASVVELQELAVTAESERGSVNRALEDQRDAAAIINSVTAEQISKTPDSDAGQAVQRVSGVSVQDGKYVFVRGLGERYTTTSLNGARIPSPEPERKVVPLDLFPAGLLEGITTSKTFTPDQPGDFSGASVDLKTREFPLGRVITVSSSVGLNSRATGRDIVQAPATGTEWLGIAGSERSLPAVARDAGYLQGMSQNDLIPVVTSFRNAWTPQRGAGSPNGSLAVSVGGEDPVFGHLLGYIGSLTYSYGQEVRADEQRAQSLPGGGGVVSPVNEYSGSTARVSVLWGGMLNLSTRLGSHSRISFNNSLTRSADNEATALTGFYEQNSIDLAISRLTFVERTVRSNQLTGEHLLGARHLVDWSATVSGVRRNEPDRADLIYVAERDAAGELQPAFWFGANRSAVRTFSSIVEDGAEGSANYRLSLGSLGNPVFVKVGLLARRTDRDADTRAYDISTTALTEAERRAPAERIFDGQYAAEGRLRLSANASGIYEASDRLVAGYGQVELPITRMIRMLAGARVESSQIAVNTTEFSGITPRVIPASLDNTDVLPSLGFTFGIGENQQLRLTASQTLSRPEYRELSPVNYFDILGSQRLYGNPDLKRALIRNLDARWEWYPAAGQIVSVGVFYKGFTDPIERILVQNADGFNPDATFRNTESAENYGIELEFRRNLALLGEMFTPFTLFANTTLMDSRIVPGNEDIASYTNAERPMTGQSEYVVNAGLGYTGASGLAATLLYNVTGPRIYEAGIQPYPDTYEQERHVFDFSIQAPLGESLVLKLDAKNLLDAPVVLEQGEVTRLRYRTGRSLSLGARWTLR